MNGRIKSRVISHMNSLKLIFNEPVVFGIEYCKAEEFLLSLGFD